MCNRHFILQNALTEEKAHTGEGVLWMTPEVSPWRRTTSIDGGNMFGKRAFLVCLTCLYLAVSATASLGRETTTTTYEGSGNTMQSAIETYQKLEPQLTAEKKKRFKDAYDGICESYQTAGILLASVMDAADPPSAHTALVSYQRIMTELPNMINKLDKLVQSLR